MQLIWSSINPSQRPHSTSQSLWFLGASFHSSPASCFLCSVSVSSMSLFHSPSPAVWLVQCLQSGDQDVLVKSLKKPPECSLKREGLRAVSLLLRDPRGKVCSAASSLLRSLADQTRHRERVRSALNHLPAKTLFVL